MVGLYSREWAKLPWEKSAFTCPHFTPHRNAWFESAMSHDWHTHLYGMNSSCPTGYTKHSWSPLVLLWFDRCHSISETVDWSKELLFGKRKALLISTPAKVRVLSPALNKSNFRKSRNNEANAFLCNAIFEPKQRQYTVRAWA